MIEYWLVKAKGRRKSKIHMLDTSEFLGRTGYYVCGNPKQSYHKAKLDDPFDTSQLCKNCVRCKTAKGPKKWGD